METTPKVEERIVHVDGRTVQYSARGPEDAPCAYVGLHGLMGGGDSFWSVIEGVPDDWRVILPDLPGCGDSDKLERPQKHDVEGYTRWLERFLAELGLEDRPLVLASVATGAPISISYALTHPEQVFAQVMHLPFFGKPAISAKWARPLLAYGLKMKPLRGLIRQLRASDRLMHSIILHEPPDAVPELAERDISHKQQADLHAAGELLHDLMLLDARADLPRLRHPFFILDSDHDFTAPEPMLEEIGAKYANCRLYIYKGGQHSWNEEFIDNMNAELRDFLGGLEVVPPRHHSV